MSETLARLKRFDARLERPVLWIFFGGAILVAVLSFTFTLIGLITALTTDRIPLTLLVDTDLPIEADAGTANLIEGTYASASVLISDLSPAPVFLWALGEVVALLTTALICAAVAHLCWKLLHGHAFDRSVSWMAICVGFVLTIGTILGSGFGGLGLMMASGELGPVSPDRFWTPGFEFNMTPLLAGFVILLVAMAFEAGTRMQHDTEGLV